MTENFHEVLAIVEQRAEVDWVLELERFAHAFVVAHAQLLDVRARRGLVREVHGDLRAEHVLLNGAPQVVDCVEFDRRLRELDVADEIAFLVMDLVASGGERFARMLVEAYRRAGGDPGPDQLIAFYASYRALVRAKVALLRAVQHPAGGSDQGRESAAARELLALAERFAWRARLPLVIVTCGVPAAGKSHLAAALAELSHLPHLSSDVTRKLLVGVTRGSGPVMPPTAPSSTGSPTRSWGAERRRRRPPWVARSSTRRSATAPIGRRSRLPSPMQRRCCSSSAARPRGCLPSVRRAATVSPGESPMRPWRWSCARPRPGSRSTS